jgi:hypothetical protein
MLIVKQKDTKEKKHLHLKSISKSYLNETNREKYNN